MPAEQEETYTSVQHLYGAFDHFNRIPRAFYGSGSIADAAGCEYAVQGRGHHQAETYSINSTLDFYTNAINCKLDPHRQASAMNDRKKRTHRQVWPA
jgi:hypothetical protein